MNNIRTGIVSLTVLALASGGCTGHRTKVNGATSVHQSQTEVPEDRLLDVAIQVFDPGLPEDMKNPVVKRKMAEDGVFPDVRRSEGRYVAYHLRSTVESSGHWGAVRVVPLGAQPADLLIEGKILDSNGKTLEVFVTVSDAAGRHWFERTYAQLADVRAYEEETSIEEPFQALYNQIANDLLDEVDDLKAYQIAELRSITQLRFASDLAPVAFGDYLERDRRGHYRAIGQPAEEDPMLRRVAKIHERDNMLVDTLNEHYFDFYNRMDESYDDWRKYSYTEQVFLDELASAARKRKILGALAMIGGIALEASGAGGRAGRATSEAAVLAGAAVLKSGMDKAAEAKMHKAALEELAGSFDAEIAPMLIQVEDQTMRLSGSAEAQYDSWREMLRGIFESETGAPVDPNTGGSVELITAGDGGPAEAID